MAAQSKVLVASRRSVANCIFDYVATLPFLAFNTESDMLAVEQKAEKKKVACG